MQNLNVAATQLASYFTDSQATFEPITQRVPYHHMGATITDAILQAGMNYKNVVYPRVLHLLKNYADYYTTCDFLILIQTIPLEKLIQWKNARKLHSIAALSWLLQNDDIQDEEHLSKWLDINTNLDKLLEIEGIGPKTVDY